MKKKYKTIYADPPWPCFGGVCKKKLNGGGVPTYTPLKKYPLMKLDKIISMKNFINKIADENCHLYLWATNPHIHDALHVIKEWGFIYRNMITWVKLQKNKKIAWGMGQYFRGSTEHCLFSVKGRLPYKIKDGKRQQSKTAFPALRKKHSEKPERMRRIIERVSYPPYIELFARKEIEDWDVWGNEVESDVDYEI